MQFPHRSWNPAQYVFWRLKLRCPFENFDHLLSQCAPWLRHSSCQSQSGISDCLPQLLEPLRRNQHFLKRPPCWKDFQPFQFCCLQFLDLGFAFSDSWRGDRQSGSASFDFWFFIVKLHFSTRPSLPPLEAYFKLCAWIQTDSGFQRQSKSSKTRWYFWAGM